MGVVDEVSARGAGQCDVVGYEVVAAPALGTKATRLLLPLPDTLSGSGQEFIVAASAEDVVGDDLAACGRRGRGRCVDRYVSTIHSAHLACRCDPPAGPPH